MSRVDEAVQLALPLIRASESLCLRAYPDPASPLSEALAARKLLRAYMRDDAEIPDDLRTLSGAPWTIGYGETLGVLEGHWWTAEQAEAGLQRRIQGRALQVLRHCPVLHGEPAQRLAACISLADNIGIGAFSASSVCRNTQRRAYAAAADSFRLWNKARGKVLAGLTARREAERNLYLN